MLILILDDDKSYGALVASACKKLGHRAQVVEDADSALSLLREQKPDVALVDLDMPERPGTEVVAWLRQQGFALPVAFCTGTCQDPSLIEAATALAEVLPRVWTHQDLKSILDTLDSKKRQLATEQTAPSTNAEMESTVNEAVPPSFARGTGPGEAQAFDQAFTEDMPSAAAPDASETIRDMYFVSDIPTIDEERANEFSAQATLDRPGLAGEQLDPSLAMAMAELRRNTPRLHIACPSWSLLRQLCEDSGEDSGQGQYLLSVQTELDLRRGQEVVVGVELPDEMVVSMSGRVRDEGAVLAEQVREFTVELTELGPQQIEFLLATCDANETQLAHEDASMQTMPRIPSTLDSVDLESSAFAAEARISWTKPSK